MRVVVPMAGGDEAFRQKGYTHSKSLIEIDGRALIQHVFERLQALPDAEFVFIIRKEDASRHHLADVLGLLVPNCRIVYAESQTAGAACTALLAIEHMESNGELVIANGDQLITADLAAAIVDFRKRGLDGGTVVFDSIHPRWSYVRVNHEGFVEEAAEKRPISRTATAGFYYFRRGEDFTQSAMRMIRKDAHVNGQYFVCPVFNEMILRQKRIGIWRIRREEYFSFGTPQGVEVYEQFIGRQPERAGHGEG